VGPWWGLAATVFTKLDAGARWAACGPGRFQGAGDTVSNNGERCAWDPGCGDGLHYRAGASVGGDIVRNRLNDQKDPTPMKSSVPRERNTRVPYIFIVKQWQNYMLSEQQ
jgi:hypothetical protein